AVAAQSHDVDRPRCVELTDLLPAGNFEYAGRAYRPPVSGCDVPAIRAQRQRCNRCRMGDTGCNTIRIYFKRPYRPVVGTIVQACRCALSSLIAERYRYYASLVP